eukprot:scaffold40834_cov31-Tisochrysis_lutea.AAC.3
MKQIAFVILSQVGFDSSAEDSRRTPTLIESVLSSTSWCSRRFTYGQLILGLTRFRRNQRCSRITASSIRARIEWRRYAFCTMLAAKIMKGLATADGVLASAGKTVTSSDCARMRTASSQSFWRCAARATWTIS